MAISAADVAKLRKITGAGMMDCKNALNETDGDFEAAIDFLRKRGQKISAKRADREATEGVIVALTSDNHKIGVVVEVNCETDFVAKNSDFIDFTTNIAKEALNANVSDVEQLLNLEIGGTKVSSLLDDQVAKIGEKIEISTMKRIEADMVVPYIHMGNKIGVLVALNQSSDNAMNIGKDIAMQIAAMNPIALNKESVAQEVIDRELAIAIEQIKAEGKPDHIADKIAQGKLTKFFKENTLLEQAFVKDNSKSIDQVLKEVEKDLTVTEFLRISIG